MAAGNFLEFAQIGQIARHGQLGSPDQLVGDTSQGRHHHHDRFALGLHDALHIQNTLYGTYGCSSKF